MAGRGAVTGLEGGRAVTMPRLLRVLLLAGVVLPLASRPVAVWAGRLPEGWERVQAAAGWWDGAMERAGLTRPYDAVHRCARAVVEAGF